MTPDYRKRILELQALQKRKDAERAEAYYRLRPVGMRAILERMNPIWRARFLGFVIGAPCGLLAGLLGWWLSGLR